MNRLLQILLDNMDKFETGLCRLYKKLYNEGVITLDEKNQLESFINENMPNKEVDYYFKCGDKESRINWIKSKML